MLDVCGFWWGPLRLTLIDGFPSSWDNESPKNNSATKLEVDVWAAALFVVKTTKAWFKCSSYCVPYATHLALPNCCYHGSSIHLFSPEIPVDLRYGVICVKICWCLLRASLRTGDGMDFRWSSRIVSVCFWERHQGLGEARRRDEAAFWVLNLFGYLSGGAALGTICAPPCPPSYHHIFTHIHSGFRNQKKKKNPFFILVLFFSSSVLWSYNIYLARLEKCWDGRRLSFPSFSWPVWLWLFSPGFTPSPLFVSLQGFCRWGAGEQVSR